MCHHATLEVSRGGGNTARGIYLLVEYTCSWNILARECPMLVEFDRIYKDRSHLFQFYRV